MAAPQPQIVVNGQNFYFLVPTMADVRTGKIRIEGQLVEPIGDKSDNDIVLAMTEYHNAKIAEPQDPVALARADASMHRAADARLVQFKRHQLLYEIELVGLPSLVSGSADDVDDRILRMERAGSPAHDIQFLKNDRNIWRNGTLVAAIGTDLLELAVATKTSGVLIYPGVWPGYNINLIAYVIELLNTYRQMMFRFEEKSVAQGINLDAARASNSANHKTWRKLITEFASS